MLKKEATCHLFVQRPRGQKDEDEGRSLIETRTGEDNGGNPKSLIVQEYTYSPFLTT